MRLVHSVAYALLTTNREQHYEAERLSGIKCSQSFKMYSFDFNAQVVGQNYVVLKYKRVECEWELKEHKLKEKTSKLYFEGELISLYIHKQKHTYIHKYLHVYKLVLIFTKY